VRSNAGLLVCGLAFVLEELDAGKLCTPFPANEYVPATSAYHLKLRDVAKTHSQVRHFRGWLVSECETTKLRINKLTSA
jgi:hypothetical protein